MLQNVEYSVADITFIKPILYADHSLKTTATRYHKFSEKKFYIDCCIYRLQCTFFLLKTFKTYIVQ